MKDKEKETNLFLVLRGLGADLLIAQLALDANTAHRLTGLDILVIFLLLAISVLVLVDDSALLVLIHGSQTRVVG